MSLLSIAEFCRDNNFLAFQALARDSDWFNLVRINSYLNLNGENTEDTSFTTCLCLAGQYASVEIVQALLRLGVSCDKMDSCGDTSLHKACRSNIDPSWKVHILLKHQPLLLNRCNKNSVIPLQVAAKHYDSTLCSQLLATGSCDINASTKQCLTALHIASQFGRTDNVIVLLQQPDIDVNAKDVNGDTPLHHAAAFNHSEIVQILKAHKHCFIFMTNNVGNTPDQENPINIKLVKQAQNGSMKSVKTLLQKGALCIVDKHNETPLHKACRSKTDAFQKVKLLLDFQRNQLFHYSTSHIYPIHIAAKHKDSRILELLIPQIDINVKTQNQLTPLHISAYFGNTKNVKLLLEVCFIDVNAVDVNGDTSAHYAARNNHQEALRAIQAHHQYNTYVRNSNSKTADEENPLNTALFEMCYRGCCDSVAKMISVGARLITDEEDNTTLHMASASSFEAVEKCKLLIDCDPALIYKRNMKLETAFHIACRGDDVELVKFFLTIQQNDVNRTNGNHHTPLHIAVINNNVPITTLLLSHPHLYVNGQDLRGETASHIAAVYRRKRILALLQGHPDSNSEIVNIDRKTYLNIWSPYGELSELVLENTWVETRQKLKYWNRDEARGIKKSFPTRMVYDEGYLYIWFQEKNYNYAFVYNQELVETESIRFKVAAIVEYVTRLSNSDLVVAASNDLYILSKTNKATGASQYTHLEKGKLSRKRHVTVAFFNERMYAVRCESSPVIDVYELAEVWRVIRSITLPRNGHCGIPYVNGLLYFTGEHHFFYVDHSKIYTISGVGKLIALTDILPDPSRLAKPQVPYICHVDSDGSALILLYDYRKNTIKLCVRSELKIQEVNLSKQDTEIKGAIHTPGRLYTLSYDSDAMGLSLLQGRSDIMMESVLGNFSLPVFTASDI